MGNLTKVSLIKLLVCQWKQNVFLKTVRTNILCSQKSAMIHKRRLPSQVWAKNYKVSDAVKTMVSDLLVFSFFDFYSLFFCGVCFLLFLCVFSLSSPSDSSHSRYFVPVSLWFRVLPHPPSPCGSAVSHILLVSHILYNLTVFSPEISGENYTCNKPSPVSSMPVSDSLCLLVSFCKFVTLVTLDFEIVCSEILSSSCQSTFLGSDLL